MNVVPSFTGRPGALISPAQHAVLDYGVAATFFGLAATLASRHRKASTLAAINGAMVLGMSLLTDYPGGLFRKISFKGHRTGDIVQAALAGLGPVLFGFARDPEAKYFYGQALSEAGVIATTDWDADAAGTTFGSLTAGSETGGAPA
jgi:hypothetical protein